MGSIHMSAGHYTATPCISQSEEFYRCVWGALFWFLHTLLRLLILLSALSFWFGSVNDRASCGSFFSNPCFDLVAPPTTLTGEFPITLQWFWIYSHALYLWKWNTVVEMARTGLTVHPLMSLLLLRPPTTRETSFIDKMKKMVSFCEYMLSFFAQFVKGNPLCAF